LRINIGRVVLVSKKTKLLAFSFAWQSRIGKLKIGLTGMCAQKKRLVVSGTTSRFVIYNELKSRWD
jgi:hypothetical protein